MMSGERKKRKGREKSIAMNNVNDFKLSQAVLLYEDIRLPRHGTRCFFLYLSARNETRDAEYKRPKRRNAENDMYA